MAQSQNSTVDLAMPATCLMGLTSHGNVMVGNKAFEYYNERNPEDYIQIPWDEVDYIAAEVLRGTKKITRFAIFTKDNGHFTFSTKRRCARSASTSTRISLCVRPILSM